MRLAAWAILLSRFMVAQPAPEGLAVNIDGVIHPVTVEIVQHAIEQAQREGKSILLVRLNTPGGLYEATRQLITALESAPMPVVTLVAPIGARAASAGFFLLLAGDVAAMTEGTHAGAASPVLLGREIDQVMRKKIESDAAAAMRSVAERRSRNPELAQLAVTEAKSFTAPEALAGRLVDLAVKDESDLWARLDGRTVTRPNGQRWVLKTKGVRCIDYQPNLRERVVQAVADPNLAFALLALGGLLIYVEFVTPGFLGPGALGAILLLVGLMALSALPISGTGVALLVLALALFLLEIKIVSHGVLSAGGVVALVLGAVLLVEGPPEVRIRLSTALAVGLPFAGISLFLVSLVLRARFRPAAVGASTLLNETGVACTELAPRGMVRIRGEYWRAEAPANLPEGTRVRVTAVEGLLLRVEPAP